MKASIRILHLRVVKGLYDISGNEESSTSNSTNNNKPPTILQFLRGLLGPEGLHCLKRWGSLVPAPQSPTMIRFIAEKKEVGVDGAW